MASELMECMKCGGQAFIVQVGNEHTPKRGFDYGCRACRITIRGRVMGKSLEWLRPKCIAEWNTRTPSPREARLEEALKRIVSDFAMDFVVDGEIIVDDPPQLWVDAYNIARAALEQPK